MIPVPAAEKDLTREGIREIASRPVLADVFAPYVKTNNLHWHMNGRHFRDYHLLSDEQAGRIFAMTDDIAERARRIGASVSHSAGDIAGLVGFLRGASAVCAEYNAEIADGLEGR